MVDLFATNLNHKLPIYGSPVPDKKALKIDALKPNRSIPTWDLSLVLLGLTKPPFELLSEAPLKWLIYKTVYLLALASVKRRSKIHA